MIANSLLPPLFLFDYKQLICIMLPSVLAFYLLPVLPYSPIVTEKIPPQNPGHFHPTALKIPFLGRKKSSRRFGTRIICCNYVLLGTLVVTAPHAKMRSTPLQFLAGFYNFIHLWGKIRSVKGLKFSSQLLFGFFYCIWILKSNYGFGEEKKL